jgi:hypothetical protein
MAPQIDLAEIPTPDMITLLFKCHKSTTVLSVLPATPFNEIKHYLLEALRTRNVKCLPNTDMPLPEDPEDLEFGVLADKKDPEKGWVPIDVKEQEIAGSKGARKKLGAKDSIANESPLGAGLSDGAWVAYRIKAHPKQPETQDDDTQMEGTPDLEVAEDLGFDVVVPVFEDEAE